MKAAAAIAILDAINSLISLVVTHATAARERGEWTSEEAAEFDARLEVITSQEHWKIE